MSDEDNITNTIGFFQGQKCCWNHCKGIAETLGTFIDQTLKDKYDASGRKQ